MPLYTHFIQSITEVIQQHEESTLTEEMRDQLASIVFTLNSIMPTKDRPIIQLREPCIDLLNRLDGLLNQQIPKAQHDHRVSELYATLEKLAGNLIFLSQLIARYPDEKSLNKARWRYFKEMIGGANIATNRSLRYEYWRANFFWGTDYLANATYGIREQLAILKNQEAYSFPFLAKNYHFDSLADFIVTWDPVHPGLMRANKPIANGRYMYVIMQIEDQTPTYQLLIANATEIRTQNKGEPHHTHLSQGKPVLCAGELRITNGTITSINNQSGHYRPNKHSLYKAITFIKEQFPISLANLYVELLYPRSRYLHFIEYDELLVVNAEKFVTNRTWTMPLNFIEGYCKYKLDSLFYDLEFISDKLTWAESQSSDPEHCKIAARERAHTNIDVIFEEIECFYETIIRRLGLNNKNCPAHERCRAALIHYYNLKELTSKLIRYWSNDKSESSQYIAERLQKALCFLNDLEYNYASLFLQGTVRTPGVPLLASSESYELTPEMGSDVFYYIKNFLFSYDLYTESLEEKPSFIYCVAHAVNFIPYGIDAKRCIQHIYLITYFPMIEFSAEQLLSTIKAPKEVLTSLCPTFSLMLRYAFNPTEQAADEPWYWSLNLLHGLSHYYALFNQIPGLDCDFNALFVQNILLSESIGIEKILEQASWYLLKSAEEPITDSTLLNTLELFNTNLLILLYKKDELRYHSERDNLLELWKRIEMSQPGMCEKISQTLLDRESIDMTSIKLESPPVEEPVLKRARR